MLVALMLENEKKNAAYSSGLFVFFFKLIFLLLLAAEIRF